MFEHNPIMLIAGLLVLSLIPFIAIMVTSYVKLVIVLSLIRNALGVQQIPPNMVLNGMAMILSLFIMAPVAYQTLELLEQENITAMPDVGTAIQLADKLKDPLKQFLSKHTDKRVSAFFVRSARQLWPRDRQVNIDPQSFYILVPAFMVTELTEAFQIGFLLYLPFIIVDLIVSNILLAMGMMMVSPMTISLPFKLLLFVLLNGWSKVIEGLILTYR
jgi:type III secretion protein R